MKQNFEAMLSLIAASTFGYKFELPSTVDVKDILSIAKKQNCYHLVWDALKNNDWLDFPEEERLKQKTKYDNSFIYNHCRFMFYVQLVRKMETEGIKPILLKGQSVARLYKSPFSRVSGDIDILVKESELEQSLKILQNCGCIIKSGMNSNTHHVVLNHPTYGCIELHVKLFKDEINYIWFDDFQKKLNLNTEPKETVIEGQKVYVLPAQTQVAFVFFHFMKHFIKSGCSIRCMMDYVLSLVEYKNDFDYKSFYDMLDEMNMKQIHNAIIDFMVKYCDVNASDLPFYESVDEKLVELVYNDLYEGGWIGNSKAYTQNSARKFAEHKKRKNAVDDVGITTNKGSVKVFFGRAFPPRKVLVRQYRYLKKCPYLYPIALISRYVSFASAKLLKRGRLYELQQERNKADNYRNNILREFDLM